MSDVVTQPVLTQPTSKPWIDSRTIWFNIVTMFFLSVPLVGAFIKLVDPTLAAIIDGALVMINGIGNIVLRVWFTTEPITTRKSLAKGYTPK